MSIGSAGELSFTVPTDTRGWTDKNGILLWPGDIVAIAYDCMEVVCLARRNDRRWIDVRKDGVAETMPEVAASCLLIQRTDRDEAMSRGLPTFDEYGGLP